MSAPPSTSLIPLSIYSGEGGTAPCPPPPWPAPRPPYTAAPHGKARVRQPEGCRPSSSHAAPPRSCTQRLFSCTPTLRPLFDPTPQPRRARARQPRPLTAGLARPSWCARRAGGRWWGAARRRWRRASSRSSATSQTSCWSPSCRQVPFCFVLFVWLLRALCRSPGCRQACYCFLVYALFRLVLSGFPDIMLEPKLQARGAALPAFPFAGFVARRARPRAHVLHALFLSGAGLLVAKAMPPRGASLARASKPSHTCDPHCRITCARWRR